MIREPRLPRSILVIVLKVSHDRVPAILEHSSLRPLARSRRVRLERSCPGIGVRDGVGVVGPDWNAEHKRGKWSAWVKRKIGGKRTREGTGTRKSRDEPFRKTCMNSGWFSTVSLRVSRPAERSCLSMTNLARADWTTFVRSSNDEETRVRRSFSRSLKSREALT